VASPSLIGQELFHLIQSSAYVNWGYFSRVKVEFGRQPPFDRWGQGDDVVSPLEGRDFGEIDKLFTPS
jgi:hypothetical protein